MNFKHQIGLHLRLKDSLTDLINEAIALDLNVFQFFLMQQKSDKYITLVNKDRDEFLKARRDLFSDIFVHSSYWINPSASSKDAFNISKNMLKKEIRIAKMLEINYLVLHAGSAKGHPMTHDDPQGKKSGIQALAKMLNSVLKKEDSVQILLENSAHGRKTVGNDLNDFVLLKEELDQPEKIGFCFDTAHAFSYGYNLDPVDDLIKLIDKTMGINNIKLIHFNDTEDIHGSMQDKHAFPGQGSIGKKILQEILNHPELIALPKIIEGPNTNKQTALAILNDILTW